MFFTMLAMILIYCNTIIAQPSIGRILEMLEENYNLKKDISAKIVLTQQKSGQGIKRYEMFYYRRDADNAFLIVISTPESEKGNGYLRIEDNFWMYRKNTRSFQHVNRDESIAGTNARGDDFERKKLTEQFEAAKDPLGNDSLFEETLGQIPVWKFVIKAKVHDVDYPRKIMWVRKDNYLLLKEQNFSSSGTLMASAYFLKYTQVEGKYIPVKQLFIDEFEKGNRTEVEISAISTKKIDNSVFTKAYLENLSK